MPEGSIRWLDDKSYEVGNDGLDAVAGVEIQCLDCDEVISRGRSTLADVRADFIALENHLQVECPKR